MRQFRPDPYPNPINTKRHPELEELDLRFRRSAVGLPVEPLSEADSQFLHDASIWLEQKTKRAESDRVLEKIRRETEQPRRQREQRRQAPSVKERMALADRVLPDKRIPRHLQHDQLYYESHEVEQKRRERLWREHQEKQG